ncbi:MAG TPA: VanW family protein [Candidatus Limiplasma sp.]|nr:VanW family protein [Candidatus Limiplasma sp.]
MFKRTLALCLAGLLLFSAAAALAEAVAVVNDETAAVDMTVEDEPDAGQADEVVVEDYVDDDGMSEIVGEADRVSPIIEGLTPLYTTKIKFLTSNGYTATIRADQDQDSEALGYVNKGDVITIYKVYPAWVLAEFEGVAGFILRTCIDEDMTTLDPVNTPPYGVVMTSYVATITEDTKVYVDPDTSSEAFAIEPGAGSKVAILGFENGFAKVLYWRSYGYIDASVLADLVVVSATDEPMSAETPIAAFSSFFAYNTGTEMNDGRVKNIVRSCESMTRVMEPGESLNFNEQVGPYKKDNGYFPAPVLIDGEAVPGYGGGTCQSSSTLYNTVRQLPGITVLYRRPHGPACARYLPMHQDAAVGSDTLNFIFRNDYDFSIRILAECTGEGILTIQIFKVE